MKKQVITTTTDIKLRDEIMHKIAENGGYCPCALQKTPDTKCMCKDFRDKIKDRRYLGPCHCGLYIKEKFIV